MLVQKNIKLKSFLSMMILAITLVSIFSCDDENEDFTPVPVILDFSPDSTTPNAIISIIGGNFSSDSSLNIVRFTSDDSGDGNYIIDKEAEVIQAQENALSVKVPLGAITGPVTVTIDGEIGTSPILTIVQPELTITGINPESANRGDTVVISGQDFSETISENVVTFGTIQATIISATSTSLEVVVPEDIQVGPITVKVVVPNIEQEATHPFEVTDTTSVTVTSYNQPSGSIGTGITIFGTNFNETASENTVSFNGVIASVTAATTNSLAVTVPEGATTGPIHVIVNGVTDAGPVFTIVFGFTSNDSSSVTSLDLLKGYWLNDTVAYIVGDDGTLLKTTDAGSTWQADTVIQGLAGTDDLYNVFFIDENNGWVSSRSGTIYSTNDAGVNWTVWEDDDKTKSEEIRAITFIDANIGWASGDNGIVLHTTDGGVNWDVQAATFDSGTNTYTYTYDDLDFDSIFFRDVNNGWAVAELGTIISTTDGGATWIDQTDSALQAAGVDLKRVVFTDANNGFIAGEQATILRTTDGGSNWNTVSITGSLPLDIDINDFTVVNSNLIMAVTDDAGLIQSFDGGTTFISSLISLIPDSSLDLEGVFASPNGNNVIAIGDDGVIIK